jgi:hypothetical protein
VKKLTAEFIGTFALVFAGTGAIVIDETTGGTVTHVGVALTFGLIVLAMIYTVGDISGAHLNPAVSLDFLRHDASHFAKPSHISPFSAAEPWSPVEYCAFFFRKTRCWAQQLPPARQSSHLFSS